MAIVSRHHQHDQEFSLGQPIKQGGADPEHSGHNASSMAAELGSSAPALRMAASRSIVNFKLAALPVISDLCAATIREQNQAVRRALGRDLLTLAESGLPLFIFRPYAEALTTNKRPPDPEYLTLLALSYAHLKQAREPHQQQLIAERFTTVLGWAANPNLTYLRECTNALHAAGPLFPEVTQQLLGELLLAQLRCVGQFAAKNLMLDDVHNLLAALDGLRVAPARIERALELDRDHYQEGVRLFARQLQDVLKQWLTDRAGPPKIEPAS